MKILLVADEESASLWDYYQPGRLDGVDLILSCGDLKQEYLEFLVTMGSKPLYYVHGNHDKGYVQFPPEGCECVDDELITVNGLRILGLGGCARYNPGPYQYTEQEMEKRIKRVERKLRKAGGVDIVITHAPGHMFITDILNKDLNDYLEAKEMNTEGAYVISKLETLEAGISMCNQIIVDIRMNMK